MNEEKMLAKIKKKSSIEKAIDFIKGIFSKKRKLTLTNVESDLKENSFIEKMEEDRKILIMQKRFESGEAEESDLTEKEKDSLIKLYNEQIKDLKKDIEMYNMTLESYKEKILTIKSKLNN